MSLLFNMLSRLVILAGAGGVEQTWSGCEPQRPPRGFTSDFARDGRLWGRAVMWPPVSWSLSLLLGLEGWWDGEAFGWGLHSGLTIL